MCINGYILTYLHGCVYKEGNTVTYIYKNIYWLYINTLTISGIQYTEIICVISSYKTSGLMKEGDNHVSISDSSCSIQNFSFYNLLLIFIDRENSRQVKSLNRWSRLKLIKQTVLVEASADCRGPWPGNGTYPQAPWHRPAVRSKGLC